MTNRPWERQKGETLKAFGAFQFYRDTAPKDRSIEKCVRSYHGFDANPAQKGYQAKVTQWKRWSARWGWVNRVQAWTDEQDHIALEERKEKIKEMQERHAKEAQALQQKAIQRLKEIAPEELSTNDVLRYFIEAAKMERLALGEATGREEVKVQLEREVNALFDILEQVLGSDNYDRVLAAFDASGGRTAAKTG